MSYNLTQHDPIPHLPHSYSHDPKSNDKALDSAVRQLFELYLPDKVESSDHQLPRPQRYPSTSTANDAHFAEVFAGGPNSHHPIRPRDSLMMRGGSSSAKSMLPNGRPLPAHRPGTMTTPWLGNDHETEYVPTLPMVQAKKEQNTLRVNPGSRPSIQVPVMVDQGFNQANKDTQPHRQSLQAPSCIMNRQASPPPLAPHPLTHRPTSSNSTGYPYPSRPSHPSHQHRPSLQIEYKHLRPIEDEPDFHFDANQVTRGQEPIVRRTRPDVNPLSPIRPQKLPWGASGPPPQMMGPMSTQFHLEQHRLSPSNSATILGNNGTFPDLDWSKQFASAAGDQIPLPPPQEVRHRKHPPRHVRFDDVVTVISAEQAPVSANNHRGGSGGRQGRTIAPVATEPFAPSSVRDLSEVGMGVDLGYVGTEEEEYEEEDEEEEEEAAGDGRRETDEEDPEAQEECVDVPPAFHDATEDQVDGVLKYKEQHGIPTARTSSDGQHDEALAAGATIGDDKAGSKFGRLKNIGKRWFL